MRQATQSLLQFLVILVGLLIQLGHFPTDINEIWLPFLYAVGGALAIWGGAQIPIAGVKQIHVSSTDMILPPQ